MGHMALAIMKVLEPFHGELGGGIRGRTDAEGDEGLLQVEAHRFFVQDFRFQIFHRVSDEGGKQFDLFGDARHVLDGVDHYARRGVHEG